MGIFSSKTVVNVNSNVNNLIANVPKSDNKAITQAILSGDSIVNASLRKHTSQMKAKVEKLNSYAKSVEYIHGLPTVVSNFSSDGFPTQFYFTDFANHPNRPAGGIDWRAESILPVNYTYVGKVETDAEKAINIERMFYYHLVYNINFLISIGYVSLTYNGHTLESRMPYNNQPLTYTKTPHMTVEFGAPVGTPETWDGYTYEVQVYIGGSLLSTPFPILVYDYYEYYKVTNRQTHAFIAGVVYRRWSGGWATNDVVNRDPIPIMITDIARDNPDYATYGRFPIDLENAVAEMTYPVIPIKYNGSYINDGTEEARVVTKALQKISLNKNEIINSLSANPDSNLIDDAYVTFGFTPHTITDEDQYIAVATILQQLKNHSIAYTDERNNVIKFTEGEFEYHLEFKRIDKTEVSGTGFSKSYWSDGFVAIGEPYYTEVNQGDGTFQYVPTPHMYERNFLEIRVPKNSTTQTVYTMIGAKGYYTVNTNLGVKYSEAKPNTEDFFLPLFENTLDFIPSVKHDRILMYSLVLITNSIQYVKVKWYQRSFFKFLLTAIAVFLIIVNPATGTFISTILAGGTPALYAIAKVVGMYVISGIAVEALIERLGKLGVVLAIIAIVVSAQMSGQISSTIDKAFKVFSSAVDTYSVYQQNVLSDTIKLNEEFMVEYGKRKSELDELTKFAEFGTGIDWLKVSNATIPSELTWYETPSEFYTRTSTVVSLPEITYSSVNDYYELNLQLPKGGNNYG